jgi:PKHD-type hydroxylase
VQLTPPEEYSGGNLELSFKPQPARASRGLGDCVVFPSYVLRRVVPMESGTRHALVQWFHGDRGYM